jgi:hypothetical protein
MAAINFGCHGGNGDGTRLRPLTNPVFERFVGIEEMDNRNGGDP